MNKIKKWLALLLAMVMVLGVMTTGAAAEEEEPQERWVQTLDELVAYATNDTDDVIVIGEGVSLTLTEDVETTDTVVISGGRLWAEDSASLTVMGEATLNVDIFNAGDWDYAVEAIQNGTLAEGDLYTYIALPIYSTIEVEERVDFGAVEVCVIMTETGWLELNENVTLAVGGLVDTEYNSGLYRTNAFGCVNYVTEDLGDGNYWVNETLYTTEAAMLKDIQADNDDPDSSGVFGVEFSTYKVKPNGTTSGPETVILGEAWDGLRFLDLYVADNTSLVLEAAPDIDYLLVSGASTEITIDEGVELELLYLIVRKSTDDDTAPRIVVADGASLTVNEYVLIEGDLAYGPGANVTLNGDVELYGNHPALLLRWLDNDEGWYEHQDWDFDEDFVISPSDEFWWIFYARTWDGEKWVETPVDPAALEITGDGLTLTPVQDIEWETIRDGETNGDFFVRVFCEAWDQDYVLSYNGLSMYGDSYQREVAFYSEYDTETGAVVKESYITWYGVNPVQENVFYFGIPEGYDHWLEDVQLFEGEDKVTLTPVAEGQVYKITVDSSVLQDSPDFYVDLAFNFTNGEDHWEGYTCGIGVGTRAALGWKDGAVWYDKENYAEGGDYYAASYFDHLEGQLRSALTLTEGQSSDGVVYLVFYDYDHQVWRCDPYPAASLLIPNNGVVNVEQLPSDWQDWGGLESKLTAVDSGTAEIYLREWNENNEDGEVWSEEPASWTTPLTVTVEKEEEPTPDIPIISSKPSAGSGSTAAKTEEPELPFTDVSERASYYDAVKYVYENGLMDGTGNSKFSPSTTLNRAMVVTILHRLEGEPAVSASGAFSDVAAGTWYTDGVEWAAANDIVNGYGNGTFGPTRPVTREQLATMLYRYAQFKGYDVTKTVSLDGYADGANVSEYAKTAVSWAVANGILESAGAQLRATENATRAEVAVAVAVFHEMYVK